MNERPGDHLDETALVDTDLLAAGTEELMAIGGQFAIKLIDPVLVAAQHLTRTDLFVPP